MHGQNHSKLISNLPSAIYKASSVIIVIIKIIIIIIIIIICYSNKAKIYDTKYCYPNYQESTEVQH